MVMTNDQLAAMIASAESASCNGGSVPAELRCQYPSKHCEHVRTTKRGGGLHRLCSFHRNRANKNQWLVDQRRRMRRERDGSGQRRRSTSPRMYDGSMATPYDRPLQPAVLMALDVLENDEPCPELGDEDLRILHALLFDEDDDDLSDLSDLSDAGLTEAAIVWTV